MAFDSPRTRLKLRGSSRQGSTAKPPADSLEFKPYWVANFPAEFGRWHIQWMVRQVKVVKTQTQILDFNWERAFHESFGNWGLVVDLSSSTEGKGTTHGQSGLRVRPPKGKARKPSKRNKELKLFKERLRFKNRLAWWFDRRMANI